MMAMTENAYICKTGKHPKTGEYYHDCDFPEGFCPNYSGIFRVPERKTISALIEETLKEKVKVSKATRYDLLRSSTEYSSYERKVAELQTARDRFGDLQIKLTIG